MGGAGCGIAFAHHQVFVRQVAASAQMVEPRFGVGEVFGGISGLPRPHATIEFTQVPRFTHLVLTDRAAAQFAEDPLKGSGSEDLATLGGQRPIAGLAGNDLLFAQTLLEILGIESELLAEPLAQVVELCEGLFDIAVEGQHELLEKLIDAMFARQAVGQFAPIEVEVGEVHRVPFYEPVGR